MVAGEDRDNDIPEILTEPIEMGEDAHSEYDGGSTETTKSQLKLEHKMRDPMVTIQDFEKLVEKRILDCQTSSILSNVSRRVKPA